MNPSELQKIFWPPLKTLTSPANFNQISIGKIAVACLVGYVAYRGIRSILDDFVRID
jgi:hypothetical protein